MALSDKARQLLTQIYAHRGYGDEKFVEEDADEALEYLLQKITDTLSDRHHDAAPLYVVMQAAVGRLRSDHYERHETETS